MDRPRYRASLTTPDGLDEWFNRLREGPLAVDTETSGLNWRTDRVGILNFAAGDTAVSCWKGALGKAARWLADQVRQRRVLVFHNSKFDMHMMRGTFGLHIPYIVHDTQVESFLYDNRGASAFTNAQYQDHHLKSLAKHFIDPDAKDFETELMRSIRANGGKHKGDWAVADPKIVGQYSYMDAWYTLRLHRIFIDAIRHWHQPPDEHYPSLMSLYETERWLLLCLRDMEERGTAVDTPYLEQWGRRVTKQRKRIEAQLNRFARGRDINWNSTPQLQHLLFNVLRIKPVRFTKKNKPSTDEASLLLMKHPIAPTLIRYREVLKQEGSVNNLLERITPDGTIHPTFKSTGAETGRLSCADPNLQQQDRSSGIRAGFIARKGNKLRFADYAQLEMRLAAHRSNEKFLIDGYASGDPDFDAHGATAQRMFGVKVPTKAQRQHAKTINFTTIYGGGQEQVATTLRELMSYDDVIKGLKEFNHRPRVAEDPFQSLAYLIRQRYFKQLPNMRKATYTASDKCTRRGFVMNEYGRHRYMYRGKEYAAFNTEIQGTAADLAKLALVRVYRQVQLREGTIALQLQIHDEIVYESDGDKRTDRLVRKLLEEPSRFRVPIVVDVSGSDTSWQAKESITL